MSSDNIDTGFAPSIADVRLSPLPRIQCLPTSHSMRPKTISAISVLVPFRGFSVFRLAIPSYFVVRRKFVLVPFRGFSVFRRL